MITRDESIKLVKHHVKNKNLVNHMICVGSIMKGLAEHFGEDQVLWEAVGILHDVDYESFGEDFANHGAKSAEMVKDQLPDEAIKAIRSHNPLTGYKPESRFDIALFSGDAISGLIVANALVRPTRMKGMRVKSIKKRMKDKSFARNVSRENIMMCEDMGLEFKEFVDIAIKAVTDVVTEIGLD